jgi:hypothetical protein
MKPDSASQNPHELQQIDGQLMDTGEQQKFRRRAKTADLQELREG